MIKEQTIFLDITPYNINNGSLINENVEILNLLINDKNAQTDCQLIGNVFEYKPLIWLEFEKEKIVKLKKLNIIYCNSSPTSILKNAIKNIFKSLEIEFFNLFLSGTFIFFRLAQKLAPKCENIETSNREENCYVSIATMRLPRFFLVYWCQQNNINNIGYPLLNKSEIEKFVYELTRYKNIDIDLDKYQNTEKRFFGNISQEEFYKKQIDLLLKTKINIVSHYPLYDYVTSVYDEKLSFPIACKTIPFFIDNISSNECLRNIGFEPYIGFDYSSDDIKDQAKRWQTLLDSNKKFFVDDKESTYLYELNQKIINKNYRILLETDWKKEAEKELLLLPENIKYIILKYIAKE